MLNIGRKHINSQLKVYVFRISCWIRGERGKKRNPLCETKEGSVILTAKEHFEISLRKNLFQIHSP